MNSFDITSIFGIDIIYVKLDTSTVCSKKVLNQWIINVKKTPYAMVGKQAEKLKSCRMKEGWMKNDEEWVKNGC